MKNYYKILGVTQASSVEAIKLAYRAKAKTCHPDISSGKDAKEKFQLINEAYQVLKNYDKRRMYDYRLNRILQKQRVQNKHRRTPFAGYSYMHRPYYKTKVYHQDASKEYSKFEKVFDNVLFIFMILVGLYAVGFGLYRLSYAPVDGVNPLAGIIAGTIFTVVIIYGWVIKLNN